MRYTTNISLCLIALSASALGWTEAETNAVVREMVGIAQRQLESEASIGSDNIVFPPVPEVETFDEHNYLSFEKSTLAYTFAFSGSDVTSADFELPVVFAGRFSQTDRQFSIVPVAEKSTAKEGTDFQLLAANEQTIKAGMSSGRGKIRLMRTPALKEDDLKLVLAIAANEKKLYAARIRPRLSLGLSI